VDKKIYLICLQQATKFKEKIMEIWTNKVNEKIIVNYVDGVFTVIYADIDGNLKDIKTKTKKLILNGKEIEPATDVIVDPKKEEPKKENKKENKEPKKNANKK
tara:strand:- start:19318 stop:19626 length:309 start_codon:yes stop_codon:yes gene_type:complete